MNVKKGFTIVELLVVIVVIAILVALTLPSLFGLQERARDTDRKNEIKNLQTALESFHSDEGRYPAALSTLISANLIEEEHTTDRQNNTYTYTPAPEGCNDTGTNCESYTVSAALENADDPDADTNGDYVKTSANQ